MMPTLSLGLQAFVVKVLLCMTYQGVQEACNQAKRSLQHPCCLVYWFGRMQKHWVRYVLNIHVEQFHTPVSQRHEDGLVTLCVAALALF